MAGGNSDGNQVLFSTDSYSWSVLNIGQFNFNITNGAIVTNFQYGCLAFRYLASQTAPTGYHRQLIEYGGNINSVQSVQTGFNCYTSTQSATITSVLAELVFPSQTAAAPPRAETSVAVSCSTHATFVPCRCLTLQTRSTICRPPRRPTARVPS